MGVPVHHSGICRQRSRWGHGRFFTTIRAAAWVQCVYLNRIFFATSTSFSFVYLNTSRTLVLVTT